VLADRYNLYRIRSRTLARGATLAGSALCYRFAPKPTEGFYFRISLDEALKRMVGVREAIGFYEAGMGPEAQPDIEESFLIFQGSISEQ
jgi:hypothetical protein